MPGESVMVEKTDSFRRNQVAVINCTYRSFEPNEAGEFPLRTEKRLFRIIAMSGETLEIRNDEVYIDGKIISSPPTVMLPYNIISSQPLEMLESSEFAFPDPYQGDNKLHYSAYLTRTEADRFASMTSVVEKIQRDTSQTSIGEDQFARMSLEGKWSTANYGPLKIPSPGDTITINDLNRMMFLSITTGDRENFVVKEKLYFLLGDNRHMAADSRFIGLIPQSKMIAVVKY